MKHRLGIAGCALALALAAPSPAGAHAVLETSTPAWNAVRGSTPASVTLQYDEPVVPRYAQVAVVTPRGQNLAGRPQVAGRVVVVRLRPGGAGSYTVRWHVVAAADGHVTQGAFSFGVRAKPLPPAPAGGASVPVAPELLIWLQFAGLVLTGGALTFRALVVVPAARALRDPREGEAKIAIVIGVAGAVLALHAGLFGFLIGASPIVGGGLLNVVNTQIIPIRVGTHPGQAWTLTTFAWLAVLAVLAGAWTTPQRRDRLLALAGLLSLAVGFGISWASHPASHGFPALIADYTHLVAAALWAGGVVALAALAAAVRHASRPSRDELFRACLVRFSRLAVPAVAGLALAGAYLAASELPDASALLSSRYGVTLVLKTGAFGAAAGLGAYHRSVVVPRIEAGTPMAVVRRTLVIEAGVLLVASALAAILTQTAPPR